MRHDSTRTDRLPLRLTEQPSAAPSRVPKSAALIAIVGAVTAAIVTPFVSGRESSGQVITHPLI